MKTEKPGFSESSISIRLTMLAALLIIMLHIAYFLMTDVQMDPALMARAH